MTPGECPERRVRDPSLHRGFRLGRAGALHCLLLTELNGENEFNYGPFPLKYTHVWVRDVLFTQGSAHCVFLPDVGLVSPPVCLCFGALKGICCFCCSSLVLCPLLALLSFIFGIWRNPWKYVKILLIFANVFHKSNRKPLFKWLVINYSLWQSSASLPEGAVSASEGHSSLRSSRSMRKHCTWIRGWIWLVCEL